MTKGHVDGSSDCVVGRPVLSVCKMNWTEGVWDGPLNLGLDYNFEAFHYDWCEHNGPIVVQTGHSAFFLGASQCWRFEEGRHENLWEGQVEDVRKHLSQLWGAGSESVPGDVVWVSCLQWVCPLRVLCTLSGGQRSVSGLATCDGSLWWCSEPQELQSILFLGLFDGPMQVISGLCVVLSVARGNYIYLN